MASAFIGFVRPVSAIDGDDLNRYYPKQVVDLLQFPITFNGTELVGNILTVPTGGSTAFDVPEDIFTYSYALAISGGVSDIRLCARSEDSSYYQEFTLNFAEYTEFGAYYTFTVDYYALSHADHFYFQVFNFTGSTQYYNILGFWAYDGADVSSPYLSYSIDFWQSSDNASTGSYTGDYSKAFHNFPSSDHREEYQAEFFYTGHGYGRVRIAIQTVNADVESISSQIPYEVISSIYSEDGITAIYTLVLEFEASSSFSFSLTGIETLNGGVTPASIEFQAWTYSPIVDLPEVAWNKLFIYHLDNMGGQLANIWTLVNSRFSDLSSWISAHTDSLVATLNGWLESIDTQIYTFRSMVDGWFSDVWESLEGIRNAIIGEANDLSNSQDYEDSAASHATEASGLVGEIDDVTKPPSDEVNTDIDDYVSADGMEMYGDMLNPILSNQYILNILVLSITLMIGSYILFGKR